MTKPTFPHITPKILALRALQEQRYQDAITHATDACSHKSQDAEPRLILAIAYTQTGDMPAAEKYSRKAIKLAPNHAGAHLVLGNILQAQGKSADAVAAYQNAIEKKPDLIEALNNLGSLLRQMGNLKEAEEYLIRASKVMPQNPIVMTNLGLLEKDKGNSSKAIDLYQQTLELHPDYADAHYNLANILQIFGATKSAENHYRKAIECNPNHVAAMHGLGQLLSSQGEIDSALELLENARRLQPTSQDISAAIADIYEKLGNHEMALAVLEPLLKSQLISPGVSLSYAKSAPYFNKHEDAIKILKRQLINSALPSQIKAEIHFSLGNLLDSIDDFEEAFENFKLGNATRTSTTDEASFIQLRGIQKQFTCDKHEQASRSNVPSSKPVFIVGMPRSGTTLVEQIVSSHPLISGAGELSYIGDILNSFPERFGSSRNYPTCMDELSVADLNTLAQEYLKNLSKHAPDATRITDKMPHNFLHLGLIDRLFPNSRIIHCVRSPMDTCLSIYFHNFSGNHPYTNNLRALGEYYKGYIELMNHWKRIIRIPLMEVVYEDLVENQEAVSRNMISFCEVDWDQQCLRFNESERIVNTPSYDQVRQPIYTKSINRWKNYEKHLEPLITALK